MNTTLRVVMVICGRTFRTGGPTNAKRKLWSRPSNTEKSRTGRVSTHLCQDCDSMLFSVCKNSLFCVPGGFFVTGINLTVDLKYICTHPKESLKDLVMSTYSMLLGWVQEQTPGARVGSINIVAGDFVTERHFAPTVVTLNEKLLKRSS